MAIKIDFDYTVKKAKEYQEVIKAFCEFLRENDLMEKWDEWAKIKNKEEEE